MSYEAATVIVFTYGVVGIGLLVLILFACGSWVIEKIPAKWKERIGVALTWMVVAAFVALSIYANYVYAKGAES